jgi:hypothetical protein
VLLAHPSEYISAITTSTISRDFVECHLSSDSCACPLPFLPVTQVYSTVELHRRNIHLTHSSSLNLIDFYPGVMLILEGFALDPIMPQVARVRGQEICN